MVNATGFLALVTPTRLSESYITDHSPLPHPREKPRSILLGFAQENQCALRQCFVSPFKSDSHGRIDLLTAQGILITAEFMKRRDIIVIGGSAGGFTALEQIAGVLPRDLRAAVFVVLHRSPRLLWPDKSPSENPDWVVAELCKKTKPPVQSAADLERFEHGRIYCGPSDKHLYLENGITRLESSPKEHHFRPSIDVLFRSAASVYGRRTIGVLLSGMLRDGTSGLWQIRKHGGLTIAQDPSEAAYPDMPANAIEDNAVDEILPAREIGRRLIELTTSDQPDQREKQPVRVLIVEDERVVAMNLEKRLRNLGYEIAGVAVSGKAAIELAGRTLPDLILMDIHLEGPIRGTEAARHIWEKFQIPIVYATAYADSATLNEVKDTAAYGYIVKPFRPKDIQAAIELALDRRDWHNDGAKTPQYLRILNSSGRNVAKPKSERACVRSTRLFRAST
jgi:chemotaxis response regulator CheB